MKKAKFQRISLGRLIGLFAIAFLAAGCRVTHVTHPPGTALPATDSVKGGSQLWAENCARCHNVRSPSAYSDPEWEVAMHHMRIRANLTAEEQRKILEFLKSAN